MTIPSKPFPESNTASLEAKLPYPPPRTLADRTLAILWRLNFAVVLMVAAWIFVDPVAARIFGGLEGRFVPGADNAGIDLDARPLPTLALVGAIGFATISLFHLAKSLFRGPARHRTVSSWLKLTALVALWLGLFASWREIAWAGDRWRLARRLAPFQELVAGLRADWPETDGKLPNLGEFSAYPIGKPTTLQMNSVDAPPGRAPVLSVDRSDDGAISFQLGGDQIGDWLQWRPDGGEPASFTDGVRQSHTLDRTSPLGDGWHLVRYR